MTTGIEFKEEIKDVPINLADGTALMDVTFAERLGMKLEDQGGNYAFPTVKHFGMTTPLTSYSEVEI